MRLKRPERLLRTVVATNPITDICGSAKRHAALSDRYCVTAFIESPHDGLLRGMRPRSFIEYPYCGPPDGARRQCH